MMMQQQRPAYAITVIHTAPPVFVETTQAEFRAVVQRLTGASSGANLINNNSNTLKLDNLSHFKDVNPPSTPTAAAISKRKDRPCACAGVPTRIAMPSESSESAPCDMSDDAAAARSIIDAHHDYNRCIGCDTTLASCSGRIKVGKLRGSHDSADDIIPVFNDVDCNFIDPGVQKSSAVSLLDHIVPETSPFACTSSIAATSSLSSLHAHPPASLCVASAGLPAADPPGAVISRCGTGLLAGVSDDDGDDDDSPGRFYCDPTSLASLVDSMIADKEQQQLELFPALLSSSSTTPASPPSPLYPYTPQWETFNSSWDDDFLCV